MGKWYSGAWGREQMLVALGVLAVCGIVTFGLVRFVDLPAARFVSGLPWLAAIRSPVFGVPILVMLAALTLIAMAGHVASGHSLARFQQVLIIAVFSFSWSLCVNEFVLKHLFGRTTPGDFLASGEDVFQWFRGALTNSFPSGHAAQIASVGTAFFIAYPRMRVPICLVTLIVAATLVLGSWHFVSDVFAGLLLGMVGAVATSRLWLARSGHLPD